MRFAWANVASATTDANLTDPIKGNTLVARTGLKVRVYSVAIAGGATATDVTFNSKSGSAGTAIMPTFPFGASSGIAMTYNPVGWFETKPGEGLTVTTGTGATQGILVGYAFVPSDS